MSFVVVKKCLNEPKQLLKLIVLMICVCVATYQLSECFIKIIRPPITTYYKFKLNDSVTYPSLTICRNPGFKTELFEKYGLMVGSPYYSKTYENFNFKNYTLDQFFDEVTYDYDEMFAIAGYDEAFDNLTVSKQYLRYYGRCYTLTPTNSSNKFSENGGFQIVFKHSAKAKVVNAYGISTTGFHVFLHDPDETLTDTKVQENSFQEYLYIETFEDIRINLRVQEFKQVPTSHHKCVPDYGYSQTICFEDCVHKIITQTVNCTAPWIQRVDFPTCNNYEAVDSLITARSDANMRKYKKACNCPIPCNVSVYSTYVQSRKDIQTVDSSLWIYFASNLITEMEEILGYDWNMFISDIGGSLGFLLGLSVIGAIKIAEQVVLMLFFKKEEKVTRENNEFQKENETAKEKSNVLNVPQINIFEAANDDIKKEKNLKNMKMEYLSDCDYYYNKQNDKNSFVSEKY